MDFRRAIPLLAATSVIATCTSGDAPPQRGNHVLLASHQELVVEAGAARCGTGGVTRRTTLSGWSTLMGEYTGTSVACAQFASPTEAHFSIARLVLRSVDGDEVWFDLDETRGGGFTVAADGADVSSTLTLEIAYEITGGTGRFEGATGTATLRSTGSLVDVSLRSTVEGSISIPLP